ncbi:acyl-CoA dehydrogenase family protein [Streptomyces flavofungini]|uniref:Acyl-CoA/acyl-ACP dehydrogenase n=1 Tax=Streptomyces flavofungini TaxID=68200 RepID=A0ABS0X0Q4_9ACTN|nr:acyl-CoA dehydrogenase family protein [Streptomyces flavofungini]MBJ3806736.1 acyl-CoA/acyl-ACP dehydrogenase [Streptomyces flavofungini]GHC60879.1 acyl-CoA dehydrogenase [Streptomyces flavofungini]
MDAALTAEQDEIRRTLREIVTKRSGPDDVKAAVRTAAGYDAGLWAALAGQLGLPGLALPERHGGTGCGTLELALAYEELGQGLAPSPLVATAGLAAPLLLALGTPRRCAELLPRVATGELTAALAVPGAALATALGLVDAREDDRDGRDDRAHRADWAGGGRAGGVQARAVDGVWRLYGQVDQVLDGHSAGLLLVAAHTGGFARSRALLFLVRGDAPGLVRVRQTALDETRPRARLELREVAGELLGDGGDVGAALGGVGERVAVLLAAEAVGAADRALARTVSYVKEREQFGRAIGSFQAVKHRLADVYVRVQAARSAAYYAAWAADAREGDGDGDGGRGELVGGIALAQGLEALRAAAAEAVQLHGGIGFTWEHDAHLYLKRASGDELLFGPVHRLRAHAADRAGLFAAGAERSEREEGARGAAGARGADGAVAAGAPDRDAPAVRVVGAGRGRRADGTGR